MCPETVLRVGGLLNLPALFVLTHLQVFCSTWRVPVCAERPDLQTNGQQLASSFSRTTTTANAEQVEVGILSHVYCTRRLPALRSLRPPPKGEANGQPLCAGQNLSRARVSTRKAGSRAFRRS